MAALQFLDLSTVKEGQPLIHLLFPFRTDTNSLHLIARLTPTIKSPTDAIVSSPALKLCVFIYTHLHALLSYWV